MKRRHVHSGRRVAFLNSTLASTGRPAVMFTDTAYLLGQENSDHREPRPKQPLSSTYSRPYCGGAEQWKCMQRTTLPGYDFPISTLFLDVLGQLVPTTAGKWITHPPTRCPSGHRLGPGEVLVGIKPVSGTAAGTRRVRAAHAMRRCTGCRLIAIARRWRGRRWCVSRPFTSEGGESPISSGSAAPPEMLRTVGWVETLGSTGVHLAQEQI